MLRLRSGSDRTKRLSRLLVATVLTTSIGAAAPATALEISGLDDNRALVDLDPWLANELDGLGVADLVEVIVHGEDFDAAASAIASHGLLDTHPAYDAFEEFDAAVALGTAAQIESLLDVDGLTYLEGNREYASFGETSHVATNQVAADEAYADWSTFPEGLEGAGVGIAVIDSGVEWSSPMFNDVNQTPDDPTDDVNKVVRRLKVGCTLSPQIDANNPEPDSFANTCIVENPLGGDYMAAGGHGTHVAGIAAGYNVYDPIGDRYIRGAAPSAQLTEISTGAVILVINAALGMNWVYENHDAPCADRPAAYALNPDGCAPIRVTNHSYGPNDTTGPQESLFEYHHDALEQKLNRALVSVGVTPVWASGNSGGGSNVSYSSPATGETTGGVIVVANYDDADSGTREGQLSGSSSTGRSGDQYTHPDVAAPGTRITSACSPGLPICKGLIVVENPYFGTISGTSMASPHVAGIAAVLTSAAHDLWLEDPSQINPAYEMTADGWLTPAAIEDLLEDTATQLGVAAELVQDFEPAGTANEPDVWTTDYHNPTNHQGAPNTTDYAWGHGLVDVLSAMDALTMQNVPVPTLEVTGPADGGVSTSGDITVTGTVERVLDEDDDDDDDNDDPTQTSATFVDASGDAISPLTDILSLDVAVTPTQVRAVMTLAELEATPGLQSGATGYSFAVDGHEFESLLFLSNGDASTWDASASAYPPNDEQFSAWDLEADTVTFTIPRDYLAGFGVTAPYYVTSSANNGGIAYSAKDDFAPEQGNRIGLASPTMVFPGAGDIAVAAGETTVYFEHDGTYGNTFYAEESNLGVLNEAGLNGAHSFVLEDVPAGSTVAFTLSWTNLVEEAAGAANDLDLYVTPTSGTEPDEGDTAGSSEMPESITFTNVGGDFAIDVNPYLVYDPIDGTTYELQAVISTDDTDTDGDGFLDSVDRCPTEAGDVDGCPDADGDGVADLDDDCPSEYGDLADGCPADVPLGEVVRVLDREGAELGSQAVDTSTGADSFAIDVTDLAEGTHVLTIEWLDDGATLGSSLLTFTHSDDDDADGVKNDVDQCPGFDDAVDVDGDGIPDDCDDLVDSDGDGVSDDLDQCPGGDDTIDVDEDDIPDDCDLLVDSDDDGVADDVDQCPGFDDAVDVDGDGIPDDCDDLVDSDDDGVADDVDVCPGHDDAVDTDGDGTPDGCDDMTDSDGDGVADDVDECPGHDDAVDTDGDGTPDGCDATPDGDGGPGDQSDIDQDGVADSDDNCVDVANADQANMDGDRKGDACDNDIDGDGHANGKERAHGTDQFDPASFPTKGGQKNG